ncbi:hypothetical protein HMPREF1869_01049, partial [Bacteroidales bacterium KA00251]
NTAIRLYATVLFLGSEGLRQALSEELTHRKKRPLLLLKKSRKINTNLPRLFGKSSETFQ